MNVDIEFHCQNDSQTGTEGVQYKVNLLSSMAMYSEYEVCVHTYSIKYVYILRV
jgi:hypothetical protein